ncbi:MAG TPA: YfhO family protein [Bacteroidia bacterium]|nr:YfhO family protein [Bacteroidia bacterium]
MKKYLPHVVALLAFVVITFLYFSPMLGGKELKQSDIANWEGMSKEITDFQAKTGEFTYWTNSMFGGMPGYQISAVYPYTLFKYVDNILTLGLPTPANYLFLFMAGFYFLLITLKVDRRVAIMGAVGFAFSSYFILFIGTGHNSKAHAIGYMAPIIAGIIMTYRGRVLLGASITGIALALQLYANHLQITYYLMMIVVLLAGMFFYEAIVNKKIADFFKASALLVVVALLAVASNITNLWATQEYGKYSTRGPSELTADKENQTTGLDRDYITDWSYGIGETFTLLIPDFKGGASEAIATNNKDALKEVDSNYRQYVGSFGSYFGDQPFTGGPLYVGAILILLFVIGLFVVEGPLKWWIVSSTLLSILLSWGKFFMSFTNFFLDNVPGYDKFRAVTTILVIAEFTIPLMAVLAVDKMIKQEDFFARYGKKLMIAMGIVIGFVFLVKISPGTFTRLYTDREYEQVSASVKGQQNSGQIVDEFFTAVSAAREHIVSSDAGRSLILLILAGALVFGFAKYRFKKEFLIYGLLVLIAIDLIGVDQRYVNSDSFSKKASHSAPFPESVADQMIKTDPTLSYRVLNIAANTFNDASTSYYHQSIGGYHGAKLKRYKELIDYRISPEMTALRTAMQKPDSSTQKVFASQTTLNMLNAKYIIYNPDAQPIVNQGALGNAWFVSEYKMVANADAELAALNNFNPKTTAIVDQRFTDKLTGLNLQADSSATIKMTGYKPNHLTYESNSNSEQLAVFSEIYYDKGWNAYVDGKSVDYVRTNYVLRAMRIPAGKHQVEWKFEPTVVATGGKITLAGSLLLILFFVGVIYKEIQSAKKAE